jgi:hypothetical protein
MGDKGPSLDDVLRKIAALERLADNAGTQEEAEAAAAKVQELMYAYGIERAQVDIASGQRPTGYGHQFIHVSSARWKQDLAWGVAKTTHCKGIRTHINDDDGSLIVVMDVVGQKDNVRMVIETYHWLVRAIDHLLKDAPYRRQGAGSRQWATDFRQGAVDRIIARMVTAQREAEAAARAANPTTSNALTVIDAKLKEVTASLYPHLRSARVAARGHVTSGYMAGYEAGAGAALRRPPGIASPHRRLS